MYVVGEMLRIRGFRLGPQLHAGLELNQLIRLRARDFEKWQSVLTRLRDEEYQIKAATGKEIALTLHSLSNLDSAFFSKNDFVRTTNRAIGRAIMLAGNSMDEHSIALCATVIQKLGSPEHCLSFLSALPTARLEGMKNPRNAAQIAQAVSGMTSVPVGLRAAALDTWIKTSILNFKPNRFKVKDIVQILHAFSRSGFELGTEFTVLLQRAILGQMQYMDHIAVSVVVNRPSVISASVSEGIIATAAQQIGQFNAQSFSTLVTGVSKWECPGNMNDIVSEELPRLLEDIPVERLGPVLRAVKHLGCERHIPWERVLQRLSKDTNESVVISVLSVLGNSSEFSVRVSESVHPLLERSRSTFQEIKNGILLASFSEKVPDQLVHAVARLNSLDLALLFTQGFPGGSQEMVGAVTSVVEKSDLSSVEEGKLVGLALWLWSNTGFVSHAVVRELTRRYNINSEFKQWLQSGIVKPVNPVYVFPEISVNVAKPMFGAPPGFEAQQIPAALRRVMDSIDPETGLLEGRVLLLTTEGKDVKAGEIAFAQTVGKPVLIVPKKFSTGRLEKLGFQVIDLMAKL
jgi:hypothetical protein